MCIPQCKTIDRLGNTTFVKGQVWCDLYLMYHMILFPNCTSDECQINLQHHGLKGKRPTYNQHIKTEQHEPELDNNKQKTTYHLLA